MSDTYSIPVACSNCEYSGTVTLQKGVVFEKHGYGPGLKSPKLCPHCGCDTLVRSFALKWSNPDNIWLRLDDDNRMLCVVKENDKQLSLNRG